MRLSTALLTAFFSMSLVACGGSVSIEPGEDTGTPPTETGLPDVVDPDTTPRPDGGGCGWGTCKAGESCFDGCNNCYCGPDGWSCTARYCEDSGPWPPPPPPPDGGPSPVCPSYLPSSGSYCAGTMNCAYSNSCGGTDYAYCPYGGGSWSVSYGSCPTPKCPAYLPKDGSYCSGAMKCSYPNSCGGSDYAYCDPSTSRWSVSMVDCPPPPPPSCPTTAPKAGSACSTSWMSCGWNNGCGGVLNGYCEYGRWVLSDSGCIPGCPSSKPSSGLGCKTPGSTSCTYVTPSVPSGYCESNCFCAEDYRWACIPGGCTSGGGGWVDAGPVPEPTDAGPVWDAAW